MKQAMSRVLLSIIVCVGLLGCGPGASDNQSNQNSPVGVSEPAGMQASPVAGNTTPPSPTTGTLSPPQPGFSALPAKPFAGSDHKARNLENPKAQERLNALNDWANQGSPGGVLALMSALNDPDERVRARADELGRALAGEIAEDQQASP
jgi:hypothetical protein